MEAPAGRKTRVIPQVLLSCEFWLPSRNFCVSVQVVVPELCIVTNTVAFCPGASVAGTCCCEPKSAWLVGGGGGGVAATTLIATAGDCSPNHATISCSICHWKL